MARVLVLLLADLTAFWVARTLLRGFRVSGLHGRMADELRALLPEGYIDGWQFAVALVLGLTLTGSYGAGDARRSSSRLLGGAALAATLALWSAAWTQGTATVFGRLLVTALGSWIVLMVGRFLVEAVVFRVRGGPTRLRALLVSRDPRVIVEGDSSAAWAAESDLDIVDSVVIGGDADVLRRQVERALGEHGVEVMLLWGPFQPEEAQVLVDVATTAGCQLLAVPSSLFVAGADAKVSWRGGRPMLELSAPSLRGWELILKRSVDLLGSVAGLLVLAPLLALIALAVRLDSSGPVFFRQDRIGMGGRRFRVWKFRTMVTGASDAAHRELVTRMLQGDETTTATAADDGSKVFKLVHDTRVTRVGALLRRYSLDELPQLFNVVRGEMSLVGPRPPLPYEVKHYDPWQYDRLQVLPGITGLWQVSGRNRLSYGEMIRLDVRYVQEWSLWLDFKILFKTIPVVLFNSGKAA
jgi:exopolysaccharide biosynthesis polyprenyl glycosylphosphotransferase